MNPVIRLFLVLAAILISGIPVSAGQLSGPKSSAEDILVGSMFKTMAKAYLSTVDIGKFKKENIKQVNSLDEDGFRRHYARFLRVAGKSPLLKTEFGLSRDLTRKEALARIKSWDKKTLFKMIDAIPNPVVNEEFKLYLAREKLKARDKNIGDQVEMVWSKLRQGFE